MAQACNPSTLGGRGRWIMRSRAWDHLGQHGETPSLLKIQKISWARWHVPVIPATREAEAGELPEPGGRGCSELRLCHCTPAWVTRANATCQNVQIITRNIWTKFINEQIFSNWNKTKCRCTLFTREPLNIRIQRGWQYKNGKSYSWKLLTEIKLG